ncbi:MAG: TolC family protein [Verrucomicrobiae bacterium]|nr:TolC family protein [Verrucomicrobiae bacterium]MCB1231207.1 TolC family protein [Verrucomicrobiae bacterium]
MKRLAATSPLFLLAFLGFETWAHGSESLDAYLREALESNPQLAADFEMVSAARQMGDQVGVLPDPKLSYTEFVSTVETRNGPQERAVSLTQAFPWPGKLTLRRSIADERAKEAFYRYEALQRKIVLEVGLTYFEYAFLGEATEVTSKNLKLLEQLVPVVDTKVRAGGDLGASLRLEVETTRVEDELQALHEKRAALSSRFESLLGREPNLERPLDFPDLPQDTPGIASIESLERGIEGHPLVVAAETGLLSAELAERLSRKSALPDINLGANVIDIGDGGDTAVGLMVGVSIPLFFDKYRAEREEKEALARSARMTVDSVEQQLISDLHAAVQEWREAEKRLELYEEKLLPSSEQAVELTEESYRNDKASVTDLIDAERTLLELQLMNQRALAKIHMAALKVRTLSEPLSVSDR